MGRSVLFDLQTRAQNGLRRGFTTGTCAAAAAGAAVHMLEYGEQLTAMKVHLPPVSDFNDVIIEPFPRAYYLIIPIESVALQPDGSVRADVIKVAGDDPDQTDGARIFAKVKRNAGNQINFSAAEGVGIVTANGLRVKVGEAAINPVPRRMIASTVLAISEKAGCSGYDVSIGCENGEEIATRTFNPRLGIKGGISILGTTGIVEPMSLSAYRAAVEVYIHVAIAGLSNQIALLPGNLGLSFARHQLSMEKPQIVHISNFLGSSLRAVSAAAKEYGTKLDHLWVLGHPGKLAKVLGDVWETHSSKSDQAMHTLADFAQTFGMPDEYCIKMRHSNTTEEIVETIAGTPLSQPFWHAVEREIERRITALIDDAESVGSVRVKLFSMKGEPLSEREL